MPTFFASTACRSRVVEAARRAPGPRAQRAPVVRLARLALVDQADDALRQARAVVGLDAGRIDRRVAPAGGDQLLGRGRIAAGGRRRTPGRARRRPAGGGSPGSSRPPPNIIITGTGPWRRRRDQRHLDVDVDRGIRRVVHVADSCLPTTGASADRRIGGSRHASRSPWARSSARGRALRDRSPRRFPAGAATTSPRRRDLLAVLQREHVGQIRDTDWPSPRRSWRDSAPTRCRSGPAAAS